MLLLFPVPAWSGETVILGVVLNGEKKGEVFAEIAEGGDFLLRREDLEAMGFREIPGGTARIGGEAFVPLRSIEGVSFDFDERTLTLRVTAPPSLLPQRTIDLATARQAKVLYPRDAGGFLNYGIGYSSGSSPEGESLEVTNTVGARSGDFLLLSDSVYRKSQGEEKFTRLMSSVTFDRRQDLRRVTAGDFFASSGEPGNSLNLGGISVSKVYRIDPYFLRHPLAEFSGLAALPSEVGIYLDGNRIRTERISPGEFRLRNLSSYDGAGVVTVTIKDAFGREEKVSYPYYFTDSLLRKGLHEYSYNAGFLRREFGIRSDEYGGAAFSFFHRYGYDDSLTVGVRGEGDREGMNLGPTATFRGGVPGVATASVAGSVGKGGGGAAALASHVYQDRRFSTNVFLRAFSRKYAIAGRETADRVRYDAGAGIGYGTARFGSLFLNADTSKMYAGTDRRTVSVGYSRNLARRISALVTWRNVRDTDSTEEIFLGLTWYLRPEYSASASYQRSGGADIGRVQVQKNLPVGEGIGFRGTVERREAQGDSSVLANPFLQYNGRYGIYSAEYLGEYGGAEKSREAYRLSAAGGVAYVGGTFGFSRPIQDSFGLVTVGGLEGVRVYRNNQEIGRTDAKGRVFVPDLGSYYENQISVNDRDIPIEYGLGGVTRIVSPPLRSGSVIPFEIRKIRAVTGILDVKSGETISPAGHCEVKIGVAGKEIAFPTGREGEFYFEDLPPGTYRAVAEGKGKPCAFELTVPETGDPITDLGRVTCESGR